MNIEPKCNLNIIIVHYLCTPSRSLYTSRFILHVCCSALMVSFCESIEKLSHHSHELCESNDDDNWCRFLPCHASILIIAFFEWKQSIFNRSFLRFFAQGITARPHNLPVFQLIHVESATFVCTMSSEILLTPHRTNQCSVVLDDEWKMCVRLHMHFDAYRETDKKVMHCWSVN